VTASPRLLLIGTQTPALQRVIPLLLLASYHVEQQWDPEEALRLLGSRRFDLVIARHPLRPPILDTVVNAVRRRDAVSRSAGVIVLAEPGSAAEVQSLLGRGVNRILSAEAPAETLLHTAAGLLAVAPRLVMRVPAILEQGSGERRTRVVTETINVSSSGLLLRGAQELAVGTRLRFELELPGLAPTIRGEATVVRHTSEVREPEPGIAVRMLSFANDGERELAAFLEHALG
jgi:DNA-binding NarL/FixJ family response regulator